MRSFLLTVALFAAATFPVHAQHLQDRLSALFIFGDGQDQLFLGGTADPNNPDAIRIHGSHFVPSAVASNGTVISFLTNSIGSNVANIPVAAASGGSTFSFEGGMPVRTSSSAGPVFGERAQTLGRGRALVALTRTGASFKTLRGEDLQNLRFTFTHANSDFPGCDSIAGGDCTLLGVPTLENETISLNLALDVESDRYLVPPDLRPHRPCGCGSRDPGRLDLGPGEQLRADQPIRPAAGGSLLRRHTR